VSGAGCSRPKGCSSRHGAIGALFSGASGVASDTNGWPSRPKAVSSAQTIFMSQAGLRGFGLGLGLGLGRVLFVRIQHIDPARLEPLVDLLAIGLAVLAQGLEPPLAHRADHLADLAGQAGVN